MNKLKGQKIVSCRICKGDHWTTRCPYKDTLGPMQKELAEQLGLSTGEKEKLPGGAGGCGSAGRGVGAGRIACPLGGPLLFTCFPGSGAVPSCQHEHRGSVAGDWVCVRASMAGWVLGLLVMLPVFSCWGRCFPCLGLHTRA